ncbi:MAG TPA: aldolase/citrate lyase family protein [Xanthobacteraceae bacterium]|nr:aldolase/citrate lyase family protein [Xanthobacteraceae bacterium]
MITTLQPNTFKRALAAKQKQVGFWLTLASTTATEIAAGAGFDWLLIDMEHSVNELPDVQDHLRATVGGTAEPVVRIPWNEPVLVKRLLDAGGRSLMFPYVQNAEEARQAVAATRYPPAGIRGFAGAARGSNYGRIKDYAQRIADEICVIVQVETPAAAKAIPEIAAVEGVDGIFIGPNDLAANMGFLGNMFAPEVNAAVREGMDKINQAGKAAGLLNFRENEARDWFGAGFTFIAVAGDAGLLARQTERIVSVFKS